MFVPMTVLILLVIGGGAGILAGALVKGTGLGFLGDLIVGIIGAFVGGFFMTLIGHQAFTGFNLWSFVVAFLGAVILLTIVRVVHGNRATKA
jgi:uncharacterized membrane protein YeaQ/YmgE (transglycosylase-associated protein family)